MGLIKKLLFAPLFLSLIITLTFLYKQILDKYIEIFFGTWGGLYELGLIALFVTLSSLTYCLYITFTQNIKYFLALAIAGSLSPFIFLQPALALITGAGLMLSFSMTYFSLNSNLKTYTNFQPDKLLSAPIKSLSTLLVISFSIAFYFYSNSIIQTQGFKLPEPIIDWAIDLSLNQSNIPVKGAKYLAQVPTLTAEQIELLKQNPQVLKQFGLNSKDLDEITPKQNAVKVTPSLPSANIKDMIKSQITESLDQIIKPYLFAIPAVLAFLFYSLTSFCLWILSFLLNPTILFIFYIFEKTGFVRFEKEMREVKKMLV